MRGPNFSRRENHFSRAILGPKNRPFLPNSSFLYFLVGKLKILITKNVKTMKLLGRKMAERFSAITSPYPVSYFGTISERLSINIVVYLYATK